MRLDVYLEVNGFYSSRNKAKVAIEQKAVSVNGKVVDKASFEVNNLDLIEILADVHPYVSRGGLKLEAAIKEFYLNFKDKVVVDIGASTGGFTDCALQHGAKKVIAIDVGTNQLAEKLKKNQKVISLEQTNIKDVNSFSDKIDFFVMDVSFVSIEYLLADLSKHLTLENSLICLIKPQFEVGKIYLKNGIVKDRTVHIKVLNNIIEALKKYNLGITKLVPSPILGGSGNKEFLACIKKNVETKINVIDVCK